MALRFSVTLYCDRDSWGFNDLATLFLKNTLALTIVVISVIAFNPNGSLENIEPYPYLKVVLFILILSASNSLFLLAKKVAPDEYRI